MSEKRSNQSGAIIRSDVLKFLRGLESTQKIFGPLAEFTIIVDANIIIGDLIWLVCKRKNEIAITELMECIQAGTFVAYVTKQVILEVEKHIPSIALKYKKNAEEFLEEWKSYKKLLKIKTPHKSRVKKYENGRDPDDAPTLALSDFLKADGILTKDYDLEVMGGLCIEISFTGQARSYSRSVAIAATIRVGMFHTGVMTGLAIVELGKLLNRAAKQFGKLPPEAKVAILLCLIFTMSNKKIRSAVSKWLKDGIGFITALKEPGTQLLLKLFEEIDRNTVEPPSLKYRNTKNRFLTKNIKVTETV